MYSRELDGDTLTLAPSGWTYRQTFVLYDKETETLWYPVAGTRGLTGISGPHKDRVLPELPSHKTRWRVWYRDNPGSLFMHYATGLGY